MILTDEQMSHYRRQIIIPEIGEKGQNRLLNSAALIYCDNSESLRPLVLYLAALGTGKIFCSLEEEDEWDLLFQQVSDINNDTEIHLSVQQNIKFDYRIVIGNIDFVKKTLEQLLHENFAPTIISINNQWKGVLQTFDEPEVYNDFIHSLNDISCLSDKNVSLATALSGALCSIEAVKLCLNLGVIQKEMLSFDLLSMEFTKQNKISNSFLEYNDNLQIEKLSKAKVLIVGVGGLGSPAAYALTKAGVNTLGLLDFDEIELSNLNRQILHSFSRIGMKKAKSAEYFLKKINPGININTHITKLTQDNATQILSGYDLIVAALDNIQTRYLVNDTCILLNKPFVEAGILNFHGTATTIIPNEGHCYRCIFPDVDFSSFKKENGILGPVPGVMGFIQAAEAIKVITDLGALLKNKIMLFDSLDMDFNKIEILKNPQCPTCSNK